MVVQRVFEYGNKQEIDEIIRFYGKETIKTILQGLIVTGKEKRGNETIKNLFYETSL